MKRLLSGMALSLLALSLGAPVSAQNYPTRSVSLIVPFPPGGPTDALARRLADGLKNQLKQTVIVENRAGAGGNIGAEYVATAKPDGYTLLFGTSGPLAINVSLYKKQNYDPRSSFAPVIRIGHLPNILVLHPSIPANTVQELIAYAKQNPDKLNYASSGNGASSHLAGIMFNEMAGTRILHIPYKGTGPALNDLLGGQVSMSFTDILTALPHLQAGKLQAIGLASVQRSDALPDLQTISEQGLPGYDISVFFGIVAPKGTPDHIIATLNSAFQAALNDPTVKETLSKQGIVPAQDRSPAGLSAFINAEVPKWRELIQRSNVALD